MKKMTCVGKNYRLEVLLSPEDYHWATLQGNWFITHANTKIGYAVRSIRLPDGKWGLMWLHKEVLKRSVGSPPSPDHHIGDHKNGNTLDNRRGNLRWATKQMNAKNRYGIEWRQLSIWEHINAH